MNKNYKITRATKFNNPFRDYKGELYKRFIDYEFICSKESDQIRKYVFNFIEEGFPIERIHCDCGKYERKHFAYYYEWARNVRP